MRDRGVPPWLVGAVLGLLTGLTLLLGTTRLLEARTLDLLFRYGLGNAPPPSPEIVHVDIDDGALQSIGRWPWPRGTLAEAVRAIDGYGAKVIAFDLLLDEPQRPEYRADGTLIDNDALLAAALREANAAIVLSARTDEGAARLGPLWTEGEGPRRLREVTASLRRDITRDAESVIRETGIDGARAQRIRVRLLDFKRLAIEETVEELLPGGAVTEEALLKALVPEALDEFPERSLLRDASDHAAAVAALERLVAPLPAPHPFPRAREIRPPIHAFAAAADGIGIVDADQDADGQLRRVRTRWDHRGRLYPQLGIAAAAAWLGLPAGRIGMEADAVAVGPARIPLREEQSLLAWPFFDRTLGIRSIAPHVSIGAVLSVGKAQRALDDLIARRARLTRALVEQFLPSRPPDDAEDPAKAAEIEEELQEEVAFTLADLERVPEPERTEKDRACVAWVRQGKEIAEARARIGARDRELRAALAGRLVFIGWNATGSLSDFYPTVVDGRTPGVVAHAIVANSCLTGYAIREAPFAAGFAVVALLGIAAALLSHRFDARLAFLLALLLGVAYAAFDVLVVFAGRHTHLALATPLAGIFVPWAGATVSRAVRDRMERARLTKQFGQRISKGLFDFLLEHPDVIHLEGVEREVTSFFSDLQGFTAISESLDSRTTVALLNRYMWAMNDVLQRNQAYVNKFLGDGIMAVWGAFAAGTPHAERACRAAIACQKRLRELVEEPEFRGRPPLSMRIGIATGTVTVGDCGAPPDLRDYTVIGDSVNLAARLESANKQFGTSILIEERTRELLPPDLLVRPIGRVTVVGQETPRALFELVAVRGEETPEERALLDATGEAVRLFQEGRMEEALRAWSAISRLRGQEKLSQLYIGAVESRLEDPSGPFDGVLHLSAK